MGWSMCVCIVSSHVGRNSFTRISDVSFFIHQLLLGSQQAGMYVCRDSHEVEEEDGAGPPLQGVGQNGEGRGQEEEVDVLGDHHAAEHLSLVVVGGRGG